MNQRARLQLRLQRMVEVTRRSRPA
jgi:hypothetical protein